MAKLPCNLTKLWFRLGGVEHSKTWLSVETVRVCVVMWGHFLWQYQDYKAKYMIECMICTFSPKCSFYQLLSVIVPVTIIWLKNESLFVVSINYQTFVEINKYTLFKSVKKETLYFKGHQIHSWILLNLYRQYQNTNTLYQEKTLFRAILTALVGLILILL